MFCLVFRAGLEDTSTTTITTELSELSTSFVNSGVVEDDDDADFNPVESANSVDLPSNISPVCPMRLSLQICEPE